MSKANYNKVFDLSAPPGTLITFLGIAAPSGWIMCTGTIGSATSGATVAGGKYANLYVTLWNSLSDSAAPIVGGRGASAYADFASNKPLTLPDMRGASTVGRVLTASKIQDTANTVQAATTLGKVIGSNGVALQPDEVSAHTHSVSGQTSATTHRHTFLAGDGGSINQFGDIGDSSETGFGWGNNNQGGFHGHIYTLPVEPQAATAPHNNMQPFLITNFIIKL